MASQDNREQDELSDETKRAKKIAYMERRLKRLFGLGEDEK